MRLVPYHHHDRTIASHRSTLRLSSSAPESRSPLAARMMHEEGKAGDYAPPSLTDADGGAPSHVGLAAAARSVDRASLLGKQTAVRDRQTNILFNGQAGCCHLLLSARPSNPCASMSVPPSAREPLALGNQTASGKWRKSGESHCTAVLSRPLARMFCHNSRNRQAKLVRTTFVPDWEKLLGEHCFVNRAAGAGMFVCWTSRVPLYVWSAVLRRAVSALSA
jgi:hypothetical protein